jgi:hypothetical protein
MMMKGKFAWGLVDRLHLVRTIQRLLMLTMCVLFSLPATATTPRWDFENAWDNNLPWYLGYDNESAGLAWGESYVLMALVTMFEATDDPIYLDRLDIHLEATHAARDDQRGVSDYRGISGACWRDWYYQDEPYCYVGHSGMIAYGFAAYGAAVRESRLADHHAPDGETYGEKADRYIGYAEEVVAYHDDQWRNAGYYVFRPDADFLGYPGVDNPYNLSHSMGRVLVALWRATGDASHLDKIEKLAAAFRAGLTTSSSGAYLWNYWGGAYDGLGEDISHASHTIWFAADCARIGVEFDDDDMFAFGETFVSHLYISDTVFAAYVGGSGVDAYPQFAGLFTELAPWRPTVWTASMDLYKQLAPAETLTSAWMLYAQAMLAKYAPPHCEHFFSDWTWDVQGNWRSATDYGANILTIPPDWSAGCAIPIEVALDQYVEVAQWDGALMHDVARWNATGASTKRFVAYEPAWPLEYWKGGVLFEFQDFSYNGYGIHVREPTPLMAPEITSTPLTDCTPGEVWSYTPEATGDDPFWWSLTEGPIDVRTDAATGEISWTPNDCTASFTLQVQNDVGLDVQTWKLSNTKTTKTEETGPTQDTGHFTDSGTTDPENEDDTHGETSQNTCGCATPVPPFSLLFFVPLVALRRRR